MISLQLPLKDEDILSLRAGDSVLLTGHLYTARDAAHKRLVELVDAGKPLPFDIKTKLYTMWVPPPHRRTRGRFCRPYNKLPHGCIYSKAA